MGKRVRGKTDYLVQVQAVGEKFGMWMIIALVIHNPPFSSDQVEHGPLIPRAKDFNLSVKSLQVKSLQVSTCEEYLNQI